MKKLKPNIIRRISDIDLQIAYLDNDCDIRNNELKKMYGITDEHFDYDFDTWTDADFGYDEERAQLFYDTDYDTNKLTAKKVALMLIGYNIARRGKPLHESTVLKKTTRLGPDGEFIRTQMARICNPAVLAFPQLHIELNKYGVTLLDYNHYQMIINRIDRLAQSGMSHTTKERRLNKYATQLKLFNAQIQNKFEQNQKTK